MDVTQTLINAALLAAFTTITWFVTRAQHRDLARRMDRHEERTDVRFERLDAKIDAVRTELEAKVDGVRTELEAKIDSLRLELEAKIERVESKVDAVRTDITQLAFRLGEQPHPQTG